MGWQGPFEVIQKVSYHIHMPGRGECLFHASLLKEAGGFYRADIDWDEERNHPIG